LQFKFYKVFLKIKQVLYRFRYAFSRLYHQNWVFSTSIMIFVRDFWLKATFSCLKFIGYFYHLSRYFWLILSQIKRDIDKIFKHSVINILILHFSISNLNIAVDYYISNSQKAQTNSNEGLSGESIPRHNKTEGNEPNNVMMVDR
jgi:hypothetical protein